MNNVQNCCGSEVKSREVQYLTPRVDLLEDKEGVTLLLDLPGVSEGGLDLTVERGVLTVLGRRQLVAPNGTELRHSEFSEGVYRRSFTLSEELDGEKVDAELKHGVLSLRIPKSERGKPKRIQIKTLN